MKIFIRTLFSVILFSVLLRAAYVDELRQYLLSRDFSISGEFFLYKNRWVFGAFGRSDSIDAYFALLGQKPTAKNPFGWKLLEKKPQASQLQEAGYFIKVDFPFDMQNPYLAPYSWIYIDKKRGDIYKLIGAYNGIFKYYDGNLDGVPDPLPNLYAAIEKTKVRFFSCKDMLTFKGYRFAKFAKSHGTIGYDCSFAINSLHYKGIKTIRNVTAIMSFDGTINNKRFIAQISQDLGQGTISYEGLYDGRYIVCSKRFTSILPAKMEADKLDTLIKNWGDENQGDSAFAGGDCKLPSTFDVMKKADLIIKTSYTITDTNNTSTIHIWEHLQKD